MKLYPKELFENFHKINTCCFNTNDFNTNDKKIYNIGELLYNNKSNDLLLSEYYGVTKKELQDNVYIDKEMEKYVLTQNEILELKNINDKINKLSFIKEKSDLFAFIFQKNPDSQNNKKEMIKYLNDNNINYDIYNMLSNVDGRLICNSDFDFESRCDIMSISDQLYNNSTNDIIDVTNNIYGFYYSYDELIDNSDNECISYINYIDTYKLYKKYIDSSFTRIIDTELLLIK